MNGIKLIVFILARGRGETLARICAEEQIGFHVTLHGLGTAGSDILNLLGIRDSEKDIVLISSENERAEALMTNLSEKLKLDSPGGGIAFSIPFSALAIQYSSYQFMTGAISPADPAGRRDKRSEKNDD